MSTLKELIDMLQKLSLDYLNHRFSVNNHQFYWKVFQSNSKFLTVWLDYSMNLTCVEKMQVQSANYSGRQQICHCALIKGVSEPFIRYVYHLSNDTNHDSIMPFAVKEDIIEKYPMVTKDVAWFSSSSSFV